MKLGYHKVDEMINSLSSDEILEFKALSIIDGWFNPWSHSAEIMATIKNENSRRIISASSDPKSQHRLTKWASGSEIAKSMTTFKQRVPVIKTGKQIEAEIVNRFGN